MSEAADGQQGRRSVARRFLAGAASTAVIGGTVFAGGIATLVVASAHHISSTTPLTTGSTVGSAVLKDSATMGATTTDRQVKFSLWAPGTVDCKGTPVFTDTEPVTTVDQGNGVTPVVTQQSYTAQLVGTYQWTAEIIAPGGAVEWPFAGMADQCGLEPAVITAASPAINTTPTPGGGPGTVLGDTATVTGGFHPTGTVTFSLFPPSDASCDGTPVYRTAPAVHLVARHASSGSYTSAAVGTYRWVAVYSGDANNKAATSGCTAEQVIVTAAQPAINTTPSAGGHLGTVLGDTATVTGGFHPTGTVTFSLFPPSDPTCHGTAAYTSAPAVALVAGQASSGSYTSSAVGTYRWVAVYSGDANNKPATSGCTAEQVAVSVAQPAISTAPSAGGVTGTAITDTATVSGGSSPTGTVTFRLYGPTDLTCTGTAIFSSAVALSSATVTSGSFSGTSTAGTYSWTADYSGDANNAAASSPCTSEIVVITAAPAVVSPVGAVRAITAVAPAGGVQAATINTPSTGGAAGA